MLETEIQGGEDETFEEEQKKKKKGSFAPRTELYHCITGKVSHEGMATSKGEL